MKSIRILRFSLLAAGFGAALSAHAGLLGSTVDTNVYYPDTSSAFATAGTAVVGPSIEYSDLASFNFWTLDFTDTTLTVTMRSTVFFNPAAMLGPGIAVTKGAAIASATFLSGHELAGLTVQNGRLFLNYSGLRISQGEQTTIAIATQPVPEPATMAALGLGVAGMIRRRKRA